MRSILSRFIATSISGMGVLFALVDATPSRAANPEAWASYLDFAYVYSSADSKELSERLDGYGREAGISLPAYIASRIETREQTSEAERETSIRRRAIGYLLLYLADGKTASIEASADAAHELEPWLGRHENRYWYGYILAHYALENGHRFDFVGEVLELWLRVVVPLESPFEALQVLALSESPNSGFVSALPYVYENMARLVLIRSQQMGLDRDLDPLASVVRMLYDGRVGAHPDVIPVASSSRDYLERVVRRLDGSESDAGSLTFTLSLFEATKYHNEARGLLATTDFAAPTIEALRVATGAYEAALERADTLQGQTAVHTRVLRLLGEVYAARQRIGEDPEINSPFSIEGAVEVFSELYREGEGDGWKVIGYRRNGRQSYVDAMHGLWEEIQEASLNAADYYISRSVKDPTQADEHGRNAARLYSRYLAFFNRFAPSENQYAVPDSAYFAAHEAAKGVGDALLAYAANPTAAEIELATRRYRSAMLLFPFDRQLWPALTSALERQGRQSEYLDLVRPAAESVTKSRHVNSWIQNGEPGSKDIAQLRSALSNSRVLLYLGFANSPDFDNLEQSNVELVARRQKIATRVAQLTEQRATLTGARGDSPPASIGASNEPSSGQVSGLDSVRLREISGQLSEANNLLARLDGQIAAQSQALPLYRATLETEGLAGALRAQRDHPVHSLLRRMYQENRTF